MREDSYAYVNGKFEPINVIPSGEIKCATCLRYFSSEAIQSHLSTHIKPKFLTPNTHENKVQKILAPKIDVLTTQDSEIDVQSMLPNEIPIAQHQRKFIVPPSGSQTQQSQHPSNFFVPNIRTEADNKDLTSNLAIYRKNENPQEFQILDLEDNYDIPVKSKIISKKSISLYKNQRSQAQMIDGTMSRRKHQMAQTLEPLQYIIRDEQKLLTESTITEKTGKKITCNFKRVPAGSTLFNTKSNLKPTYIPDDRSQVSEVRPYKIKDNPQTPLKTISKFGGCDNKCPCCGGFYCTYCQSSIPPKYRPVHEVSPQQEQQIKEFYKAYNKSQCKNCQK